MPSKTPPTRDECTCPFAVARSPTRALILFCLQQGRNVGLAAELLWFGLDKDDVGRAILRSYEGIVVNSNSHSRDPIIHEVDPYDPIFSVEPQGSLYGPGIFSLWCTQSKNVVSLDKLSDVALRGLLGQCLQELFNLSLGASILRAPCGKPDSKCHPHDQENEHARFQAPSSCHWKLTSSACDLKLRSSPTWDEISNDSNAGYEVVVAGFRKCRMKRTSQTVVKAR